MKRFENSLSYFASRHPIIFGVVFGLVVTLSLSGIVVGAQSHLSLLTYLGGTVLFTAVGAVTKMGIRETRARRAEHDAFMKASLARIMARRAQLDSLRWN